MHSSLVLLVTLLTVQIATATPRVRYLPVSLPWPEHATSTYADALNDRGDVVISATIRGRQKLFIVKGSRLTSIGGIREFPAVEVRRVNNSRQSVGSAWGEIDGKMEGASFLCNGRLISFPTISGDTNAALYDLNESGVIVGCASMNGTNLVGFIYDHGSTTLLHDTERDAPFLPTAINDSGFMAGVMVIEGSNHGVFARNNTFVDFCASDCFPTDVNEHDDITGCYTPEEQRGFLFSRGALTDLGQLRRHYAVIPLSINNACEIVGYAMPTDRDEATAFVWRDGVLRQLNDLVVGVHHRVSWASQINNRGIIAATTVRRDGSHSAVLLLPIGRRIPARSE